ncbi:TPA: hypothetical protein ACFP4M_001107 [Neisseria subflava]
MNDKKMPFEEDEFYIEDNDLSDFHDTGVFYDDDGIFYEASNLKDTKTAKYVEIKKYCFSNHLDFRLYRFNPFNPRTITGDSSLININDRALNILKVENFEALNIILLRFRAVIVELTNGIDEEDNEGFGEWLLTDVATLIQGYINSYLFNYEDIFQDGLSLEETKPKIFALLAIYLIGSICNEDIDINRTRSVTRLTVQAMEAICTAERLRNSFINTEEIQKRAIMEYKQEMARKAGKAKQSPYEKAGTIAAITQLLEERKEKLNQRGGKAELISLIIRKINNGEIPAPDVPAERTVVEWIKKFEQNMKSTS